MMEYTTMTCKEVGQAILDLLKQNGCTIRGYEGETSCVIIGGGIGPGVAINNETQEFEQ